MSPIEKLIAKTLDNYEKIESGERSIAKGKVLNESANIVIRLALLQLQQAPALPPEEVKKIK
ncbi:MAG: hypothetical protein WBP57_11115 [Ignavibacteria bacterium]